MIKSFKDKETEKIFRGRFSRKSPRDIQRLAARKLEQINAATVLETLRIPPGNQLEALCREKGDRQIILSRGADANTRNKKGKTALDVAREKGDAEIVRLLMKAGTKE